MLAACGLGVDLGHFIGLLLLTLVIIKLILPFVRRFNVFGVYRKRTRRSNHYYDIVVL